MNLKLSKQRLVVRLKLFAEIRSLIDGIQELYSFVKIYHELLFLTLNKVFLHHHVVNIFLNFYEAFVTNDH